LSHEIEKFLCGVVEHFGTPIAPVRMSHTTPISRPVDDGEAATVPHIHAEEPPENAGTSRETADEK
jgi:hypothetical protein